MLKLKLSCTEFNNGEYIPKKYTCDGHNISPPLRFENIPDATKSLVLIIEDPCTRDNNPRVHWLVFNIPPTTIEFYENTAPKGAVQGLCNGNTFGYEGPCPSEDKHYYEFKLYALDTILSLPPESNKIKVLNAMSGHILDESILIGFYKGDEILEK